MKRPLIASFAFISLIGMVFLVFPRALTGDYAKVHVDKIEIFPDGRIDVSFSGVCSSGSFLEPIYHEPGRPVHGSGGMSGEIGFGFPHPVMISGNRWSPSEVENLAKKLFIKEGQTYLVKNGKPLVLFDLDPQTGRHNKGLLKLTRQKSCLF